jgi:hypothetical protein
MMAHPSDAASLENRLNQLDSVSSECLYFAVTLTVDDTGRIIFATPTEWTGAPYEPDLGLLYP